MIKDLQAVKKILEEIDAEMLSYNVIDFTNSEEILRGWPASKIPNDMLDPCAEYLSTIGSNLNNDDSYFITDPIVGKEEWPGKWQRFFGGWQIWGRERYLTQTLRKGYYQTVSLTAEAGGERIITQAQQHGLTMETPSVCARVAGAVVSQQININRQDGSRGIDTNTDAGQAQTSTTKIASKSGQTTIEEKTVQDTALVAPTAEKGYIKRIINVASRYYQRWTTTNEVEQPTNQTATYGEDTGMQSVAVTRNTENSATPSVAVSVQGTRTSLDSNPTRAGNLDTTASTHSSKAVSVPEYVARYSEGEVERRTEEYHKTTPPDIKDQRAAGIETSVLSHNLDDYLTHNYVISKVTKSFPFTDDVVTYAVYNGLIYQTLQTYSEALGRYWNSSTRVSLKKATYTMKYFHTPVLAAAYITGAYSNSGGVITTQDNSGSHFVHTGDLEYLAIKIVHTKIFLFATEYTEPTS